MNYKNKLMGLSLIIVAMFSACSDEVENGDRDSGTGDHRITFAVSTQNQTNGTRSAFTSETHELGSVKMEGKLDGKPVYLTAEVSDGFPGDDQPLTRGTQVNYATQVDTFAVSAYKNNGNGTPEVMYNVKVTKNNATSLWTTEAPYYWPTGQNLDVFAWYPYALENLTISGKEQTGYPTLTYEVPVEVAKQQDMMFTCALNRPESVVPLQFVHLLTAVKFKTSTDMPACTIKSITLKEVKYKGIWKYTLNASLYDSPWVLDDRTNNFTLNINKDITANTETALTGDGETFFMIPQEFGKDSNAQLEVKLEVDGAEQTLYANLKDISTSWQQGKTITYTLSYNYVTIAVSNEKFIAYVDDDAKLENQICFEVWASSSKSTAQTATISVTSGSGITVSPTSFSADGWTNNVPVYVSWEPGISDGVITVSIGSKSKQISLHRELPAEGDAFYLYSVPETTSKPFGKDFLCIYNKSDAQWLTMTNSSSYDKNAGYQSTFDNQPMGDAIYLQTLSIPSEDRFASLLATTTMATEKENVMYCVEQKAGLSFTADFGFKDCERNISREAEKWNIKLSVTGERLKKNSTSTVKARVVITDQSYSDTNDGCDLTYGDPVEVIIDETTGTGVSATPYIKRRWDDQQETPKNNGTRSVNVQVCGVNSDTWIDASGTGTMADWMTWGDNFAVGYKQYITTTWEGGALQILRDYCEVHEKHPMFGLHRWSIMKDMEDADVKKNALYLIFSNAKYGTPSIHKNSGNGQWSYLSSNSANSVSVKDPDNPNYDEVNNGGYTINYIVNYGWHTSSKVTYPGPLAVWIPVVYSDSHCGLSARPTDDNPITGTSVNE